jgi:hypothetical protein
MSISPAQCRAARALIDVVTEFENGGRIPSEGDLAAIRKALESAGVIFIEENGEGGPGVRLRKMRGR